MDTYANQIQVGDFECFGGIPVQHSIRLMTIVCLGMFNMTILGHQAVKSIDRNRIEYH